MRESRALTTNALDTMSAAWACLPIGNLREAGCHFRTGAVVLMLEEDESALPALRSHVLSPAPEVGIGRLLGQEEEVHRLVGGFGLRKRTSMGRSAQLLQRQHDDAGTKAVAASTAAAIRSDKPAGLSAPPRKTALPLWM